MSHPGSTTGALNGDSGQRLPRHKLTDRILHWLMAVCILILLGTSLLPIAGVKFAWVLIHWVTGLVLTAAVLVHIVRSLIWKSPKNMWFWISDLRDVFQMLRWDLTGTGNEPRKPGKYSPPQKLLHYAVTVIVLVAIVTGLMMLVKIDSPFWERDPYWITEASWGLVYVLHGFTALFSISVIMIHIYFALRPEKRLYTRSMIKGWISREEYQDHHDSERWKI